MVLINRLVDHSNKRFRIGYIVRYWSNKNKQRCHSNKQRSSPTLLHNDSERFHMWMITASYEPGRSAAKTQPQGSLPWFNGCPGRLEAAKIKVGGFNQPSKIFEEDKKPRGGHATVKAHTFASWSTFHLKPSLASILKGSRTMHMPVLLNMYSNGNWIALEKELLIFRCFLALVFPLPAFGSSGTTAAVAVPATQEPNENPWPFRLCRVSEHNLSFR